MGRLIKVFAVVLLLSPVTASWRLDAETKEKAKIEKIGGTYLVKSIVRDPKDFFKITFVSAQKTGRFDTLTLESDHVHFSLKEGDSIRLSAEVVAERGSEADIGQMLLFVPNVQGYTPIWLLSRNSKFDDLKAGRYLEMHAPQSDFRIL